jgi:hypothetical protein
MSPGIAFVCRFCPDAWIFWSAFTAGGPIKVSTLVMKNHAIRHGIGAACGTWFMSTCAAAAEARLRSKFRASCVTAAPTGSSGPFRNSHHAPCAAVTMVVTAAGMTGGASS